MTHNLLIYNDLHIEFTLLYGIIRFFKLRISFYVTIVVIPTGFLLYLIIHIVLVCNMKKHNKSDKDSTFAIRAVYL